MAETRNVQIPLALFKSIIQFFEFLDFSTYSFPAVYGCDAILRELRKKQLSINLHSAFAQVARAKDDAQRDLAMSDYINLKKRIDGRIRPG